MGSTSYLNHNGLPGSPISCESTSVVAKQVGGQRSSSDLQQVGVGVGRVGVEGGGGGGRGQRSAVSPPPNHLQGLGREVGGPAHSALQHNGAEPPDKPLHVGVGGPNLGAVRTCGALLRG